MSRRIRIWASASLAAVGLLAPTLPAAPAAAQIAQGPQKERAPIDITANTADRYDEKHLAIYRGDVEAVQNGARLLCDELQIYSYGPDGSPDGKPGAVAAPKAAPAAGGAAPPAQDDSFGSIKQIIAIGHVFYVTQTQSARGERGVYDAEPDTITMTGNVVVVQGENVIKGDKMIIDRKTGHTTMVSTATGRNKPDRVRGVFYNDNSGSSSPSQAGPATPQPPKKP